MVGSLDQMDAVDDGHDIREVELGNAAAELDVLVARIEEEIVEMSAQQRIGLEADHLLLVRRIMGQMREIQAGEEVMGRKVGEEVLQRKGERSRGDIEMDPIRGLRDMAEERKGEIDQSQVVVIGAEPIGDQCNQLDDKATVDDAEQIVQEEDEGIHEILADHDAGGGARLSLPDELGDQKLDARVEGMGEGAQGEGRGERLRVVKQALEDDPEEEESERNKIVVGPIRGAQGRQPSVDDSKEERRVEGRVEDILYIRVQDAIECRFKFNQGLEQSGERDDALGGEISKALVSLVPHLQIDGHDVEMMLND